MTTIRTAFDRQLELLRDSVVDLSQMVSQAISESMAALRQHDVELARQVDQSDKQTNAKRFEIEGAAYTLIALQQPNAGDMRAIVSAASIATNLERIGDHAAGIARLVLRMDDPRAIEVPSEFEQMAEIAQAMLHEAMTAYISRDKTRATSVITRDREIDQLHKQVSEHLLQTMTKDTMLIKSSTLMLWISHNLERIADYVTNVCERVIYLVSGELTENVDDVL